jgi:signal transduction histidine kinase
MPETRPLHIRPPVSPPQDSADELRLLYEAGQRLGRTLDPALVFETLRELVTEVMDCDGLLVSSYSPDDRIIRCSHAWIEGEAVDPSRFPPVRLNPDGRGMQSRVITSGEPLLIGDVEAYTRAPGTTYYYVDPDGTVHNQPTADDHSLSAMMVPITLEGEVRGVVQVMCNRRDAYVERDLRIFGALAALMAAASRNALLFQQAQAELAHRRAIEAALRVSEQRYRDLVQSLERRVQERTAELTTSESHLRESHSQMVQFSYTISHDLRAPIRAIRGYLDAILEELGEHLGEDGHEYAVRIIEATKRMDLLIGDLLAYSRVGQLELVHEAIGLTDSVHEAIALEQIDFEERRVRLSLALDPASLVLAHRPTLVQVIWNLLENAMKFVPPDRSPEITIRSEDRGDRTRLWVEDNGIGIAPEHQGRIFDVFVRLETLPAPGTGIGLAMVRRALNRMGGAAGVVSEGRGSQFWIELRRAEPSTTPH